MEPRSDLNPGCSAASAQSPGHVNPSPRKADRGAPRRVAAPPASRSLAHLPCTSGRCPEAAHQWGRHTRRRAPSGTAGTGGSSRRCSPHIACGLGRQGRREKVPERALDTHAHHSRCGHPPRPAPSPTTRNPIFFRAPQRTPPLRRLSPALSGRIPGSACVVR